MSRHQRCFFRAELEWPGALRDAFDEELGCGIGEDVGHGEVIALGRAIQRKQSKDPFAFAAKRLAAGGEHMQLAVPREPCVRPAARGSPAHARNCRRSAGWAGFPGDGQQGRRSDPPR